MGKKRAKGRQVQPDKSLEPLEPVCKHLRKGLEQGHLKKVLQNVDWNACQDCRSSASETHEKCEEEEENRPSIWLCLKCGHRGCGRDSKEQHALKHYEIQRSEPHCLVLSLDNWSVWHTLHWCLFCNLNSSRTKREWLVLARHNLFCVLVLDLSQRCYLCDNEVQYNSSTQLGQLVGYIRKQALVNIQTPKYTSNDFTSASTDEENKQLGNKKIKDHRNEEEREKKEILTKENNHHLNDNVEVTVKGLSNLGNTCFFNAVLQNLSQTPILRELLKEVKMADSTLTIEPPEFSVTEPLVVKLDQPRPLTLAMCQFLTEMQETKKGPVNPRELFSQVCKKAIRFKGYQQQDSQELLRYLLDGMRTEETQRMCAAIFKALDNHGDKENEELKKKIKEYTKKKAPHSFVDRVFGGELISTIMCEECQTVSLVHESFLDLSLPVLNDQIGKKKTNDKNIKNVQEKEMKDEDSNMETDSYLKERDEAPGTSKHLQKKAKKIAKKQAKNQRRQQKIQEKVIHLTDPSVTEKSEVGQDCNKETESSTEVTDLKQEEESLNQCEKRCANENEDNAWQEVIKDAENTEKCIENTECWDQEANSEAFTDFPTEDLVSAVQCVNKFDHLSSRQGEISKEDKILEVDEISKEDTNVEEYKEILEEDKEIPKEDKILKEDEISEEDKILEVDEISKEDKILEVDEISKEDKILKEDEIPKEGKILEVDEISMEDKILEEDEEISKEKILEEDETLEEGDEISHIFNRLFLDAESDNMDNAYELDSDSKIYEVVNEDSETAFCTLANRELMSTEEGSVLHCLYQFTCNEKLCENNKLLCDVCTRRQLCGPKNSATNAKKNVYTNAKKQMLISLAPPVLTLHLKRFQQAGYNLQKVNKHIKFHEVMDLAPFCSVKCKNVVQGSQRVLYSLYGVVEHSGTMRSGHYTAYVKTRPTKNQLSDLVLHGKIQQTSGMESSKGQWFHISDTHVQAVPVSKVLNAQAYLLFYERLL